MLALIVHVKCKPSKSGGFATRLSTKVIKGVSNSKKMSSSLLVVSTFEATPLVTGEFTIKTRMHLVDVLSLMYHQLLFASVLYSTINAPGFIMLKIITILVISGCALGSPVVDQSAASSSSNNQFESTGVVIKQIESSLDVNDAVLKQRLGAKRTGFLLGNGDQPHINAADFDRVIPSLPQGNFHGEHHDPNIGTEEAAARAVNSPLFFDTFEHGHMVMNYAERRKSPLLFRSIRPNFPFSDLRRTDRR